MLTAVLMYDIITVPTQVVQLIRIRIEMQKGEIKLSLITVDLRDRKQLYEQIIDNVKNLVLTGELVQDDKLPSVRSLAKELGINPNTIQKAYTELEREGIIRSLPGRGSMILADKKSLCGERKDMLKEKMQSLADEMFEIGITEAEFFCIAEIAWKNRKNGGVSHD
ncbi:MAG: GntR family transcriptional regulator [Ruminococcaceae bacterium]|nr:GntR family transcriptional regulator [Oscillospiraceae bacterium]